MQRLRFSRRKLLRFEGLTLPLRLLSMSNNSEKAAYQEAVEARAQALAAQIETLKAKAKVAKADAKVKYQEQLDTLETKQTELNVKLESIKGSAGNAWEEIKTGVESAWSELQVAFDKAKSEIDKA